MVKNVETLMILLALVNLYLLGSNRLVNQIRAVFAQGVLLFFFVLASHSDHLTAHIMVLAAVVIGIKGIMIPWLLKKASVVALDPKTVGPPRSIKDEFAVFSQPHVGFGSSVGLGMLFILVAFWVGSKMTYLPSFPAYAPFAIPIAIATILTGLLVVVGRMQALTQAIGYLVIENGVFAYGISLSAGIPLMVEVGIMLDVLGGVMVMGVALFHINQSFARIEIEGEKEDAGHG